MTESSDTPSEPQASLLTIDVVSDVVCPWCFVGKRQLESALTMLAQKNPDGPRATVNWHPFQLNPDMPVEGIDRSTYLNAKFGESGPGDAYDLVKQAAQDVDLTLAFDKITHQPNTVAVHSLMAVASPQIQNILVEALFEAHFLNGVNLSEEGNLIEIGRSAGLTEAAMESALNDESVSQSIHAADKQIRELGVKGVPFFILNRQLAVSGAAGAENLLAACEKVLANPQQQATQAM